jgi:hypothetical protein
MAPAARLYTSPPSPDPLVAIPLASDRRVVNHCGTTGTEPTKRNPMPSPKHMPWLRKSCHISFAKEAPIKLADSSITPICIVTLVPKNRVVVVATGEISIAQEIDREPTKAYSNGVAPGKVSCER